MSQMLKKISHVANIVEQETKKNKVIVVLSAMAEVTNKMESYQKEAKSNHGIENDLILTSGENITIGLLSAILK